MRRSHETKGSGEPSNSVESAAILMGKMNECTKLTEERRRSAIAQALLLLLALTLFCGQVLAAQESDGNPDHPAGNVNELTLAGLRPGRSTLQDAIRHYGPHWFHPTPQETDLYLWSDPAHHLLLSAEVNQQGQIRVVSVTRTERTAPVRSVLPLRAATTGRGVRLGTTEQHLRAVYGKPFFEGPSSLNGHDVHLIVYNFSWAGTDKPQILESSFDRSGHLVKMSLSAEYY